MSKKFNGQNVIKIIKLFNLRKILLGGQASETKRKNKNL